MKDLQKEFENLQFTNNGFEREDVPELMNDIWSWIQGNYISKKSLITKIKELQEEPSRQGIIDIINSI